MSQFTEKEFALSEMMLTVSDKLQKASCMLSEIVEEYGFVQGLNISNLSTENEENVLNWVHDYEKVYTHVAVALDYISDSIKEVEAAESKLDES